MRSAADRWAQLDMDDPEPTTDELLERAGIEGFRFPDVGEVCGDPMLDVARYWPGNVPA